jgi:hypothetical protein
MSVDELRRRAVKLESRVYWRNAREYFATIPVVIFYMYEIWVTPAAIMRTGFALIVAGLLYLVWQLHRRGSSKRLPEDLGLASGVEFFRRELERQRNMVQDVWKWYLAPLVPGLGVVLVAIPILNPHHLRHPFLVEAAVGAAVALGFYWIGRINQHAARCLQKTIDELDALRVER